MLDKEEEEKLVSVSESLPELPVAMPLYVDAVVNEPLPAPEGDDKVDDKESTKAPV